MWVRVSLTICLFVCFISVHRNRKQNFNKNLKLFYNRRKIVVDKKYQFSIYMTLNIHEKVKYLFCSKFEYFDLLNDIFIKNG